ncbi:sugar ABC transporter ATP-binding protein [Acrocarpospora sp. B8E8]|uniref:sugar ABC transporter ATP-binding protein n=1 Tax=Acrocarpospora sp. B8E8 TaxID=3153572 RepID=UPI00325F2504
MTAETLRQTPDGARGHQVAELRSITKRFGATLALDEIDLTVHVGRTHGLIGRNGAGKSTVVGVLTGLHRPDSGVLTFGGQPAPFGAPRRWRRHVACVYQHPMLIPNLSVAENLLLDRLPRHRLGIDWRRTRLQAAQILEEWDLRVAPTARAGDLDVEQAQLLEIAKALSHGSDLIVLDEPTARLDSGAAARLFATVRRLQRAGATFLLISHYLHEVFDVCDEVTVLRDGRRVGTHPTAEVTASDLVEQMVGDVPPPPATASAMVSGQPRLTVSGFSGARFHDLNLTAAAGEIVGLAGLVGSGRSQVGEALGGLGEASGRVILDGGQVPLGRVDAALATGIALIPRDRHQTGMVAGMRVDDNLTLADERMSTGRLGVVSARRRRHLADSLIAKLDVRPARRDVPVGALSGGNQQKVVFGRALATRPRVLIAVEPTAGVDIASKTTLLNVLNQAAAEGTTVIVCSDDLDDLRICHRVLVMRAGRLVTELNAGWSDRQLVGAIEGTNDVED